MEDLHEYVGAYTARPTSGETREAAERGRLHLIGATTAALYGEYIAKDAGLARLFRPLEVAAGEESAAEETADAAAPADKLSPELRALAAESKGGRVGVILQADDLRDEQIVATLRRYGVQPDARMTQLGALRVEVPVAALKELASADGSRYLSPDRELHSFGHITSTTGTDLVRNGGLINTLLGNSLDGDGIGIAVLDSGIDVAHRAFSGMRVASRVVFKKDFTAEKTPADKDPYGHGTHVAAAAAGISTSNGSAYEGVARGADIINLRVLDSKGAGRSSDVLAALNWILSPADPNKPAGPTNPTNATKYNIRVVNLSLGAPAVDSYRNDPLCLAVRKLVDAGIVVVAAAGNQGVGSPIDYPASIPSALSVASTDRDDARSDFSNYNDAVDLAAPGDDIVSAFPGNNQYRIWSGTSMATPWAAGAAALLLEGQPSWTPAQVGERLRRTAAAIDGPSDGMGAGRLAVDAAVGCPV